MTDYKKLGLKAGIEIHQRLGTENKLFCDCPANAEGENPKAEVIRKQRAIAGELGDIDPATMYEYYRNRIFSYQSFNSTCNIELDSDFPRHMNKEALDISLQIALLMKMNIPDEVHIMRKIVTDGSNTSGYQRTALVALGNDKSVITTKSGDVRLQYMQLEEESSGIIGEHHGKITYSLNRLGIPLVEIGTHPDIKSPEQALEVAESIGMLLRAVKVARGIGTIRQDVNVSIKDGARVEIKGFQELKKIPELIDNEVQRQVSLLKIKKQLQKMKFKKPSKPKDVTELFKNTNCSFIKKILNTNGIVLALKLDGFAGLLKTPCGGKNFGKELAYYVMPYGPKGIIDTDEDLTKYQLTQEFESLKKEMRAKDKDLLLIISDKEGKVNMAMSALIERIEQLTRGVPEETRVALPDATTKYTRPLPGAGRMYPETDLPYITIDSKYIKELGKNLPKTLVQKVSELEKDLPKELAEQLIRSRYLEIYDNIAHKNRKFVASTLLSTLKELKRNGLATDRLKQAQLQDLFDLIETEKISKDVMAAAIEMLIKGSSKSEITKKFGLLSKTELTKIVKKVKSEHKDLNQKALMGLIMAQVQGRASGKEIIQILKK